MITDDLRRHTGYHELKSPYEAANKQIPRRTLLTWLAAAIVVIIIFITLFNVGHIDATISGAEPTFVESWNKSHAISETANEMEAWDPLSVLKGPPTAKFRDNLKKDAKYVTTWPSAGWTNDVMTFGNLIYLGLISDRVPIVPSFTPTHVAYQAGQHVRDVPFGEVFDVPRLSKALGKPVLEWRQVKNLSTDTSSELETIGCWNIWEASQYDEAYPRKSPVTLEELKLDVSYMTAPDSVKLIPKVPWDKHATFWSLVALSFPEFRSKALQEPKESPIKKEKLHPDEHLMCIDYMYYLCAFRYYEYTTDYSPVWRNVGKHMHWTPRLLEIADQYVRASLGTSKDDPSPEYIAVHVRHGDFGDWCVDTPLNECFAPISAIALRVEEVRKELDTRLGIKEAQVIITSDEKDLDWWQQIADLGYKRIDHSQTVEKYGKWYPVFVDAVIQSSGVGFVGTYRSTMSLMAKLRVQSWRDGATRTVKWGKLGADDHDEDHQDVEE